jgi:hypothetical protein
MRAGRGIRILGVALLLASCGAESAAPTRSGLAGPEAVGRPAAPPVTDWRAGEAAITEGDLRAHIEELSSDAYAGRDTLSEGGRKAAAYIAARFAEVGLRKLPGQSSYLVDFTLEERRFDESATSLTFARGAERTALTAGEEFAPLQPTSDGAVEGQLVYAGYGRHMPEKGWDDYAGLDVKGKIVFVLRHVPNEKEVEARAKERRAAAAKQDGARPSAAGREITVADGSFQAKAKDAQDRGALGMIVVTEPSHERDEVLSLGGHYRVPPTAEDKDKEKEKEKEKEKAEKAAAALASEAGKEAGAKKAGARKAGARKAGANKAPSKPERPFVSAMISRDAADKLLAGTGRTLAELQAATDAGTPVKKLALGPVRAALAVKSAQEPRQVTTHNVVGFLPGSDPARAGEWVVIGGHYDHVGVGGLDGDTIHNGADDNASGTAGVLALARAFASLPAAARPARSLVFVGFDAEEKGLLGSEAILRERDIPPEKVVFMLNLDMIGRNPDKAVGLLGDAYATGIKELTEAANADIGVKISWVGVGTRRDLSSSDHAPFMRRGIPAMFFFSGTHEDYHQVTDHADKISYERVLSLTRLGFRVAGQIADAPTAPRFIHQIGWLDIAIERQGQGEERLAVVTRVAEGKPGHTAGIAPGDQVVRAGDTDLATAPSITEAFDSIKEGTRAKLAVLRDGVPVELEVERAVPAFMGVTPTAVPPDQRSKLGLAAGEGLLLAGVTAGGPAARSKLEAGDIVLRLNNEPVDADSLGKRLHPLRAGDKVPGVLLRHGKRLTLTLTLGKRPSP